MILHWNTYPKRDVENHQQTFHAGHRSNSLQLFSHSKYCYKNYWTTKKKLIAIIDEEICIIVADEELFVQLICFYHIRLLMLQPQRHYITLCCNDNERQIMILNVYMSTCLAIIAHRPESALYRRLVKYIIRQTTGHVRNW